MYESFYGFDEKPFSLLPDPEFLYLGEQHSSAVAALDYGMLNHAGFIVVTGEIGSGKTTLIRHLLRNLEPDVTVGLISNTHESFGDLLQWVLLAFGLEYKDKSQAELYETLIDFLIKEYAEGRRTVLIVDEAQNLDVDTLENLRLLSNINTDKNELLQTILVGQPDLRDTLKTPKLMQFTSRIGVDYHIKPLSMEETIQYIRHRVELAGGATQIFGRKVCAAVHDYSGGVPRLINMICDTALVYGYGARRKRMTVSMIDEVVSDKLEGGLFRHVHRTDDSTTAVFGRQRGGPVLNAVNSGAKMAAPVTRRSDIVAKTPPQPALTANEDVDQDSDLFRELFSSLSGEK